MPKKTVNKRGSKTTVIKSGSKKYSLKQKDASVTHSSVKKVENPSLGRIKSFKRVEKAATKKKGTKVKTTEKRVHTLGGKNVVTTTKTKGRQGGKGKSRSTTKYKTVRK